MFTVKITPQAAEDLLEIKNYIENELKNPIAAHITIKTIVETYENLSTIAETTSCYGDRYTGLLF